MLEFAIKDCALSIIATGRRAQTLRELRNVIRDVHPGSIYYHFWGTMLRPQLSYREFNNDFATWCHSSLHDFPAAERLGVIDPADYSDMEELRQELVEVIDERLDETELMLFAQADHQFHFARSVIVVFDTHRVLTRPVELLEALPRMSVGSIFYHFVDARRREPVGKDDFSAWLSGMGPEYSALVEAIGSIDPFFESLFSIRERMLQLFQAHFAPEGSTDESEPATGSST